MKYSEEIKRQAIKLYMEGNSERAVGRIWGISKNTCLYWIRKYAKKIEEKNSSNERVKVIEMDELYTYAKRKNKIYVITLVNREKRQIVGYDIAFDKSRERIQKLVDSSPKADHYYSDAYYTYSEICYYGTHTALKYKSQTYTVEGVNSDLRHYIPPLRRKSKCFFRSIETARVVFKIFVFTFNKFALAKFLHPSLKSSFSLSFFVTRLNLALLYEQPLDIKIKLLYYKSKNKVNKRKAV